MTSVKFYVGARCKRPIQPAPCSVPAPAPSFSVTPTPPDFGPAPLRSRSIVFCHAALRSALLHSIFGPLRSVFRSAHAPLTCCVSNTNLAASKVTWRKYDNHISVHGSTLSLTVHKARWCSWLSTNNDWKIQFACSSALLLICGHFWKFYVKCVYTFQ